MNVLSAPKLRLAIILVCLSQFLVILELALWTCLILLCISMFSYIFFSSCVTIEHDMVEFLSQMLFYLVLY